jgi:hypothetical protein
MIAFLTELIETARHLSVARPSANSMSMNLRHAAALALVGWYLMLPVSSLAATAKPKLLTYTNKAYGVSFRYPSDWTLNEGDNGKLSWGYLGDVGTNLRQGVNVAAVVMPKNSYKGIWAFFKLSVDSSLSARDCNEVDRRDPDDPDFEQFEQSIRETLRRVGPLKLTETESASAGLGHSWCAKYYHVYRNHACYEFQQGEGVNGDTDVNYHVVFRRLDAILATVTIRLTTIAPPPSQGKVK